MVDNGRLDYTKKQDYGKVPAYLNEVKAQIDDERAMITEMLQAQDMEGDYDMVTELSDEERKGLIAALQAKWDAVNAQYQLITFKRVSSSNSTVGAVRRCVRMPVARAAHAGCHCVLLRRPLTEAVCLGCA